MIALSFQVRLDPRDWIHPAGGWLSDRILQIPAKNKILKVNLFNFYLIIFDRL